MDDLGHARGLHPRLLQQLEDARDDAARVVVGRRQHLPRPQRAIGAEQHDVGERPTDVDADPIAARLRAVSHGASQNLRTEGARSRACRRRRHRRPGILAMTSSDESPPSSSQRSPAAGSQRSASGARRSPRAASRSGDSRPPPLPTSPAFERSGCGFWATWPTGSVPLQFAQADVDHRRSAATAEPPGVARLLPRLGTRITLGAHALEFALVDAALVRLVRDDREGLAGTRARGLVDLGSVGRYPSGLFSLSGQGRASSASPHARSPPIPAGHRHEDAARALIRPPKK